MEPQKPDWYFCRSQDHVRVQSDHSKTMGDYSLRLLIKELGQNSIDACFDSTKPVILYFDLIELPKEERENFLNILKIDINNLNSKLKSMAEMDKNEASRYDRMKYLIDHIKSEENVYILRVIDTNTCGLRGDPKKKWWEDLEKNNFNTFFFITGLSQKPSTQMGSHGEGLMGIFMCSKLQLVMTLSHINETTGIKPFRKFGKMSVGPFVEKSNGNCFDGVAYFGINPPDEYNHPFPIEFDDINSVSTDAFFSPELKETTGTAFYYPFFDFGRDYEENEGTLNLDEFFDMIKKEFEKWFFPAIIRGDLEVVIRLFKYPAMNSLTIREPIQLNKTTLEKAFQIFPGTNPTISVKLKIPRGRGKKADERELMIFFVELDKTNNIHQFFIEDEEMDNSIICCRNKMVIQYLKIQQNKINYERGKHFIGLLIVKDEEAEKFLRLAEPPSHDKWIATPRLKAQYPNSPIYLSNFLNKEIIDGLREVLEIKSTPIEKIDENLYRDLFPFFPLNLLVNMPKKHHKSSLDTLKEKQKELHEEISDENNDAPQEEPEEVILPIIKKKRKLKPQKQDNTKPQSKPKPEIKKDDNHTGNEQKQKKVKFLEVTKPGETENIIRKKLEIKPSNRDKNLQRMDVTVDLPENCDEKIGGILFRAEILNDNHKSLEERILPVTYFDQVIPPDRAIVIKNEDFPINFKINLNKIPNLLIPLITFKFEAFGIVVK